jgi:hypothetical protein
MARGAVFHIAEGDVIENFDIELIPGGVITGRVTDSNGRPLVEERVRLWWFDKNGTTLEFNPRQLIRKMLTTDDRGVYRIFGLPEGRYIIFGRVMNADDGKPVGEAKVELGLLSPDGNDIGRRGFSNGHSNSNGAFQLSNVPPGKYFAYVAVDHEPDKASNMYSEPVICEVNNSDVHGIEIKLRKGGSIEGVVVIEDPADPAMSGKIGKIMCLFHSVEDRPGELRSPTFKRADVAPNDSFKVEGTPKGKVQIITFNPNSSGSSLIRIERGGAPLPGDSIEIGAGEHISNLRLVTATPNLSLPGAIKVVGGTLPPTLSLYIYASRLDGARGAIRPFQVDVRNHFLIQYLAPGEYELRLEIPDYSVKPNNVDPQLSRAISQARQKVVVSRNNQQPAIMTLDLSRGGAK